MGRRQEEELRRLEDALFENDSIDAVLDFWNEKPNTPAHCVYNTDETDVDLDAFSEEVHQGRGRTALPMMLTMLAMVALSAGILLLLKLAGVL